MTYKVRAGYFLVELLDSELEPKETNSGIILPEKAKTSDFIRLEVIAVPLNETIVKAGDIVVAEKMFVPLDSSNKTLGLIAEGYVHLVEEK